VDHTRKEMRKWKVEENKAKVRSDNEEYDNTVKRKPTKDSFSQEVAHQSKDISEDSRKCNKGGPRVIEAKWARCWQPERRKK
jgi:hypothetical protein